MQTPFKVMLFVRIMSDSRPVNHKKQYQEGKLPWLRLIIVWLKLIVSSVDILMTINDLSLTFGILMTVNDLSPDR